jgi:hypothetical protein
MDFSGGVDELSGAELLDTADALARGILEAEAQLLEVAAQWAVVNGVDTVDPEQARLPGRQTAKRYGGAGTPEVASFAPAELGARIGRSTWAAEQLIADALDLAHRLPQLWARVQGGEVRASYARHVARRTRDLDRPQAAYVDERVAESADGRITWGRFTDLVEAAVLAADPAAAEAAEKAARAEQFARRTRSTEHGMAGFYLRTDAAGIARLDATVAYLADALAALGCTEPLDARRAMAMVILANPAHATRLLAAYAAWRRRPADPTPPEDHTEDPTDAPADPEPSGIVADAVVLFGRGGGQPTGEAPVIDWRQLLPAVQLIAHVYAGECHGDGPCEGGLVRRDATGIARIEGIGAVTEAWVRDLLGPRATITHRPVLDLAGQAPVDAWEIPDRHRRAVRLMTPADTFPFATATVNQHDGWPGMQIDHTVPHPDGPTAIGNYGPLTGSHHNLKTHGHWDVAQPFPGIYLWRDPHGIIYLVDHTGTRRLRNTDAA